MMENCDGDRDDPYLRAERRIERQPGVGVLQSKIGGSAGLPGFESPGLFRGIEFCEIASPWLWRGRAGQGGATDPDDIIVGQCSEGGCLGPPAKQITPAVYRQLHAQTACSPWKSCTQSECVCRLARGADVGAGMAVIIQAGRRLRGRGEIGRWVGACQWPEHPRNVQPAATVLKKGSRGVPEIIVQRHATVAQLPAISIDSPKVTEACHEFRAAINGTIPCGADEAGCGGAHSFDRFGSKRCFSNVNSRGEIVRHHILLAQLGGTGCCAVYRNTRG